MPSTTLIPDHAARVADQDAPVARRARSFDPLLIAALATTLSLAGAARPSLWFDEAATISAASSRSIPELWRMVGNIDAVHGLYYLLMQGWFAFFPPTEFWSRASSGLAVGAAAAGVVVLTRRFSSRSVALSSGVVFAILPRTTWAGIEARSYALCAVAAVWLTVLLVVAVQQGRTRLWPVYAAALTLAVLLNVFLVLLVPVHAVQLWVLRAGRPVVLRWTGAACAALLLVTPFIAFSHGQVRQVGWIFPLGTRTFGDLTVQQYFDDSVPCAVCAGVVIAIALLLMRFRPQRRPDAPTRRLLLIASSWIAIPTAVLLLYSALFEPMYYPRYLYFTAPAAAVVLGFCVTTLARTRTSTTAVLVALAVAAAPNYVIVQRGAYAKEGMDFSQVADVLTDHAAAGDCLLLDNTAAWKPGPIRPITAARPSLYGKLVDLGRGTPAAKQNYLWDAHVAIWDIADWLPGCTVIWLVSERDATVPDHAAQTAMAPGPRLGRAPAYQVAHRLGFSLAERWQFSFAQVAKLTR